MGDDSGFKIVKVKETAPLLKKIRGTVKAPPPPDVVPKYASKHRSAQPKHGILKHGKTARKMPRFEGVKDPAKGPPVKKQSRLRILTEHGAQTRRTKIAKDAKTKSIHDIRKTLKKHNLNVRENTPEHLARKIYEDAQEAGMIS
jgi:isopropylmalate/homocitrate/citramalate synthase